MFGINGRGIKQDWTVKPPMWGRLSDLAANAKRQFDAMGLPHPKNYWLFWEGGGAVVRDLMQKYNVSLVGSTWKQKSSDFDGNDDYAETDTFTSCPAEHTYVTSAYFPDVSQSNYCRVIQTGPYNDLPSLGFSYEMPDRSSVKIVKWSVTASAGTFSVNLNKWNVLAHTFSVQEGKIKGYKNGQFVFSGIPDDYGDSRLTFGCGDGSYWQGRIGYCLLFDAVLPPCQIALLYEQPYRPLYPMARPLFFDMGMGAAEGLTFNSIIQGQTVMSPTLAQLQNLGISSVAQSQTVDSLDISQIHAIITNAIKQGQTIDSLSLQQMISLAIDAINQGQSVDQATVSQLQQLAIDSVKQNQGVDSLTVDQLISLTINNVSQDQLVDSPTLTIPGELTINSIVQGQNVVSPTLQQAQGLLDVANITQGQSVNAISLEQVHSLITDSINQGQSIDTTNLDQIISLAIDSVSQGQTLSEPSFYSVTVLDIDSIQQGQTVEATSVSQVSQLIIDEINQGQVIENINFSIAKGRLQIKITGKKPGVDFDGKAPTTKFQ